MKRKEYTKPIMSMAECNVELLWGSDIDTPTGASDDTEVVVRPGTVDPEDALARPGYSVWDE